MNRAIKAVMAFGVTAAAFGLALKRRPRQVYPDPTSYITEPEVDLAVAARGDGVYEVQWHMPNSPVAVVVGAAPDAIHWQRPELQVSDGQIFVSSVPDYPRPYFEVELQDGKRVVVAERFIPMEGISNFRDLGGYRTLDGRQVRWGTIFRSGKLSNLTENDRALIEALGIHLVCDLRSKDEVADYPHPLNDDHIGYVHLPLEAEDSRLDQLKALLFNRKRLHQMMPEMYTQVIIDGNARLYGNLLQKLANPDNLPTVVHCTAGKDRTGILAALLLLVLGVPERIVVADYTLSNHYFSTFHQIAVKALEPVKWLGVTADDLQPLLVADTAVMQATINHIRTRYGSVEGYLHSAAGVDASTIKKLRENLLVE